LKIREFENLKMKRLIFLLINFQINQLSNFQIDKVL